MNLLYDGEAPRRGDISHPLHPCSYAAHNTQGELQAAQGSNRQLATLLALFALFCEAIPLKPWVLRTHFSP